MLLAGQQAASSVLYTTSCKHILALLRVGEIIVRNMLIWLKLLIIKLLLLHLVGFLYCCINDARSHEHQIYNSLFFNQRCRPSSSLYTLTYVHNTCHKLYINLNTPTSLSDKSPSSGWRRKKGIIDINRRMSNFTYTIFKVYTYLLHGAESFLRS